MLAEVLLGTQMSPDFGVVTLCSAQLEDDPDAFDVPWRGQARLVGRHVDAEAIFAGAASIFPLERGRPLVRQLRLDKPRAVVGISGVTNVPV